MLDLTRPTPATRAQGWCDGGKARISKARHSSHTSHTNLEFCEIHRTYRLAPAATPQANVQPSRSLAKLANCRDRGDRCDAASISGLFRGHPTPCLPHQTWHAASSITTGDKILSAYIKQLQAGVVAEAAGLQARREKEERAAEEAAREKLVPLETRLARLLATIPPSIQAEGLSLMSLPARWLWRQRWSCA